MLLSLLPPVPLNGDLKDEVLALVHFVEEVERARREVEVRGMDRRRAREVAVSEAIV